METAMSKFPQLSTGGSLLIAWQLKGKRILIVGGGNVAADRIRSILVTWDAPSRTPDITLVSPLSGLNDEVRYRIYDDAQQKQFSIHHIDGAFQDEMLTTTHYDMVLTATDDPELSKHIWNLCKSHKIPINVADVPPLCDFYFGSVIKRGPLQIMISTNGKSPRLANRIRREIEQMLPSHVEEAIENMGKLRADLRRLAPDAQDGKKRMEFMIQVTDKWSLDDLCQLDQDKRNRVLQGWETHQAYSLADLAPMSCSNRFKHVFKTFMERIDVVSLSAGLVLGASISVGALYRR